MINIFRANISFKHILNTLGLYYDSGDTISEFKPLDPFFTFGLGKNPIDGFYYFGTMSKGGAPLNRSQYVFKYDITTNQIIEQVHIPKSAGITSSYDVHAIPTIQFDALGHIYMTVEKCKNNTGWSDGHVTDVLIYKTEIAGDLSTMILWSTIVSQSSYPKLFINGTTYYCQVRGLTNSYSIIDATIKKSIDSGGTWTEYVIATLTSSPLRRPYTNTVMNFDNSTIALAMNIRNDTVGVFESLNFMQSIDGVNWSNALVNFTKNVSVDGALTLSEINTNMSIWYVDPSLYQVCFEGGCLKDGVIKILASKSELSPTIVDNNRQTKYIELRLYTFDNGVWTYNDVSSFLPANHWHFWAYERTLQYVPSLNEDCIFVLDNRNTADIKLSRYKSTDNFNSYQQKIVFKGAGNYYYGSHAFNSISLDEQLIILNDTQGAYTNSSDSSNLRIVNP